jgi:hypothetical protein
MTSKERLLALMSGRAVDRAPVFAIYDGEYGLRAAGYPRDKWQSWDELPDAEVGAVLGRIHDRHPRSDLIVCTTGNGRHPVARLPHISATGDPAALPRRLGELPTAADVHRWGIYDYFGDVARAHGQRLTLASVIVVPLANTINAFGGYEDGLVAMITHREAFRELYLWACRAMIPRLEVARALGMHAVWITQFYAGLDTISPAAYRELIQPGEELIFEGARRLGLKTFFWFLYQGVTGRGQLCRVGPAAAGRTAFFEQIWEDRV